MLTYGDYRLSRAVDFLCADREGYSFIRRIVRDRGGLHRLFPTAEPASDLRIDRYGVRRFLQVGDTSWRVEIVSEGYLGSLTGVRSPTLGVPILDAASLCATKLLANSDRFQDRATLCRDVIDLGAIIHATGGIPDEAWQAARRAYGDDVRRDFDAAREQLRDPVVQEKVFAGLDIDAAWRERIAAALAVTIPAPPEPEGSGPEP